jgi:membrane-bound lytic murein transglycosylase B
LLEFLRDFRRSSGGRDCPAIDRAPRQPESRNPPFDAAHDPSRHRRFRAPWRRREFFEGEFIAALKLIDQGVPRWRLKGSWAGATGYPQFMPSVALRLRADGDGDGYADIWANELDGLASIAQYLRDAGWKPNVVWGVPVRTPANLNRAAIVNRMNAQRCPQVYRRHSRWLSMREWRALGVTPMGRSLPETEMASLIEPDGPNARAFLLTTKYRAILDYNCSNFYAISVGVLADAIARR